MSENTQQSDKRTLGYVLKRVNYGEYDRILNLLTPIGKFSVIAKGVRKEKSKLAGGIEIFTLSDFNVHFGRGEMGLITSAKMIKHYGEIVKDFSKMELASAILKNVSKASEGSCNPDFFKIVDQSLRALDVGINLNIVEAWYLINLRKAIGEEINLYRDIKGEKLKPDKIYDWNYIEMVFEENLKGNYGVNEIKMLRLMASNDLNVVSRVKISDEIMRSVLRLSRGVV